MQTGKKGKMGIYSQFARNILQLIRSLPILQYKNINGPKFHHILYQIITLFKCIGPFLLFPDRLLIIIFHLNPMGACTPHTPQKHKDSLTIATLNYCGILSSPFEFYSQENQQEQAKISAIFRKLIPQYIPSFVEEKFQWEMGKVGKDIQKGRFSLMFDPSAGSDGVRFMSKEEFQTRWDEDFLKLSQGMKAEERSWTEQDVKNSKLFDLIFYHALLLYIFGFGITNGSFEEAIKNDPVVFQSKIDHFYHQIFLDQQQKLSNFRKGYIKLRPDVFFVQEYSQKLLSAIKKEKIIHVVVDGREDSLIIINQLSFKEFRPFNFIVDQIEERAHREQLWKWGSKLAISVADQYVFICAHLSSKSAVNPVQIQQLRTHLLLLKNCLPKYKIVLGGDLNSFFPSDEIFSSQFRLFPQTEQQFTTIKKRTFTQAQYHKAELEVKESKDRIITTEPIEHGEVAYMGGEGKVDPHAYLPSNAHPYDHLLCVATLRRH